MRFSRHQLARRGWRFDPGITIKRTNDMRASIVIASHNEGELLWKTVRTCRETIGDLECEIVVVDDASEDNTVEELLSRDRDVKVIVSPERRGVSAAKDLAARSSRGDVLVFLDAHCKPEPGAIARLVEDAESWQGKATISPRIDPLDTVRWENQADSSCSGFWLDLEWFHSGWFQDEPMPRVVDGRGRAYDEQPCLVGCCLAIGRELYETLWGFDRDMQSWGVEDLDLGLKCWLMGYRHLVDHDAVIGHRFRDENSTYAVPSEHFYANQLRMARKNFGEAAWANWLQRFRETTSDDLWDRTWTCFERSRASVELERDYLMRHRCRDEYQYAAEFGLAWPLILPSSPLPYTLQAARPRFARPQRAIPTIKTPTRRPPPPTQPPGKPGGDDPDDDGDDQDDARKPRSFGEQLDTSGRTAQTAGFRS
jgi:glycosyltransferase involved in cell wall biosynthesis